MGSPALQLAPQSQQGQPDQSHQQNAERSPANPATGKPEDRKAQFFRTQDPTVSQKWEGILKDVWRQHTEDWAVARRQVLRDMLRAIEYRNGNQHIGWDPLTSSYVGYNDIVRAQGYQSGTEQGNADYTPQKNVNIIDWLCRVWCSTLGAAIPGVEWWPGVEDSDLDSRGAVAKDRAYKKIASDNMDKDFLEQCLEYLFLTGSYFRYIRYSMDPQLTGTHFEDVVEMQDQQVSPDRFQCPQCGAQTPVDLNHLPPTPQCPQCGKMMTSADFYPGARMKMPVVTGQREVPNGQVRWDAVCGLSVQVMPHASTTGGGVIANTPLLEYQCDITKGAFRRMYPDSWDLASSSTSDGTAPDSELSRLARMRATTPGGLRWTNALQKMPTLHRVWYTQDAISAWDNREEAQQLADMVGEGCVGVWYQDKLIDIQPDVMRKRWSWCGCKKNSGAYPVAPVRLALDFQDRVNDRVDGADDYFDRLGCPPVLYNQTVFGEALNGAYLPAGTLLGVPVNLEVGRKMEDGFFQPQFHQDNNVFQWIQALVTMVQLLVGITPQTYGGHQEGIDTFKGQEQALKVAMGVLWLYWNLVRSEWSKAAVLSVDCFAENATNDEFRVTKSIDSGDFDVEPIVVADLDGKADARPEANQDYPIGYEQQRELYKQLFLMAGGKEPNPLVMEVLDTFEARRQAMRYLGPPDMELPETPFHYKVLADIEQLIASEPIPSGVVDPQSGQPVMTPSVQPDPDIDDMEVTIDTTTRYCVRNFKKLQVGSPPLENLRAYLKMAIQIKMKKEAAAANPLLTAGVPGWGGSLGGPLQRGAPPPGGGGPPNAPAPMPPPAQ